jgi:hypothetical protein
MEGQDEGGTGGAARGVATRSLAAGKGEAEDGFGGAIATNEFEGEGVELVWGVGQGELEDAQALLQALEVFGPEDGLAAGDEEGLEEGVAVEEAAVEDGDEGFGPGEEFVVEEDEHLGIRLRLRLGEETHTH